MKRELLALAVVLFILLAFPAALFAYQTRLTNPPGVRVITLTANAPGKGGWQPDAIQVNLGETVRLRIASTDVVHGFAVPALGIDVNEILPGHVQEVEFRAAKAGRFPFACTRWCSVDHWRMRGVIDVINPAIPEPTPKPAAPPLYQKLGINIDALHPAQNTPPVRASAARGAVLAPTLPAEVRDAAYLRTHAPAGVWARLRSDDSLKGFSDAGLWDAVAWLWKQAAGEEAIASGEKLFARDCAACHGETGRGNGPAGVNLPGLTAIHAATADAHMPSDLKKGPANLTDGKQMLGASDALLQGKLLRGGMGTGMPEWGSLYSEQQMWDVIAYIRSFVFDYSSGR
ncbi:MAG: c-type cytochrome [Rudaea sp.]